MPSSVVKSYSKASGKSVDTVERFWDEAKKQADKKFPRRDKHYWAYVNSITKRRSGVQESITSFKRFISPSIFDNNK